MESLELRGISSHVSKAASRATVNTFEEPGMLRGVPSSRILANRGALLATMPPGSQFTFSTEESEALYGCARPVTRLDWFISHSWQDPGFMKYLSVLWIRNNGVACCCANIVAALWLAFEHICIPLLTKKRWFRLPTGERVTIHLGIVLVPHAVVYVFVLSLGHKVTNRLFDPVFFLDKCCISQADPIRKAQGIARLGAFLRSSKRLLVLWTPSYFDRLWCVYEVACFMSLVGQQSVDLVPIKTAPFCLMPVLCMVLIEISMSAADLSNSTIGLLILTGCVIIAWLSFIAAKQVEELQRQVQHLRLADTKCYCCSVGHKIPGKDEIIPCDRDFVKYNIDKWFAELTVRDDVDGTAAFERCVREQLFDQNTFNVGYLQVVLQCGWQIFWLSVEASMLNTYDDSGCTASAVMLLFWNSYLISICDVYVFMFVVVPWCSRFVRNRSWRPSYTIVLQVGLGCLLSVVISATTYDWYLRFWVWARNRRDILPLAWLCVCLVVMYLILVRRSAAFMFQRTLSIICS